MAQYGSTMPMAGPRGSQQAVYANPMPVHAPAAPAGTFSPGTKIQVGEHRVVIQKYLSEGGFAHVYLVKLPKAVDGTDLAVLKRVAVPDRETLRGMRTEVETMKRLKGHRPIVTYIDSHASEIIGGGFEVFLLMEYCSGGGLIDFMNTRLQHRLTEPEILNIFTDVAEGVACMHYLKPPLLHRDLKVENVLITMVGSKRKFKLCDFGSAAPPKPAPQSIVECRLLDEDVQKHTTMQYRSPEMIDVYRKQPIDEKSDIWALGVLLYKLCYYTTPFEEQGQLAILNASFKFPSYPVFSDRLKHLIASMLRENLQQRPNIYQVLREGCVMQGREVPIHDIYSNRSKSDPKRSEKSLPAGPQSGKTTPVVGAVFSPPQQQEQKIPEVVPMRRGRLPAATPQPAPQAPKPSVSPARVTNGDPFAALDSKSSTKPSSADELSTRFPTLDQFSILHDQGAKFEFDSPVSPPPPGDIGQRVTERLADDAFAVPQGTSAPSQAPQRQSADLSRVKTVANPTQLYKTTPPPGSVNKPSSAPPKPEGAQMSRASAIISSNPELQAIASPSPQPAQPVPSRPSMVSTGTMTSTPPPQEMPRKEYPPIYRFPPPDHQRSSSLPRQSDSAALGQIPRSDTPQQLRPGATPRVPSYHSQSGHLRQPSSSRPSLEGGRPSVELLEPLTKASSQSGRPRPASTYLESNLDFLRERESAPRPLRSPGLTSTPIFPDKAPSPAMEPLEDTAIESNVDFLRSMEETDNKKKDKSLKHSKRSSLSSLSGTKNILAGRFGDAFKRFEGSKEPTPARTPSPLKGPDRRNLTPIAGSEATDSRSDDGRLLGDREEMTPEQRREAEAQALADEERRVEAAAAEYRQRMAAREAGGPSAVPPRSIGGVSRAVSIQNRVQNLLQESQKPSNVPKTAEGYGRFSDAAANASRGEKPLPELPRKPVGMGSRGPPPAKPVTSSSDAMTRTRHPGHTSSMPTTLPSSSASANRPTMPPKPSAPPKPTHLNSIPTGGRRSPSKQQRPPGPALATNTGTEQFAGVGRDSIDMTAQEKEDYIRDFSKRFPSLSAIEMVERDIGAESGKKGAR